MSCEPKQRFWKCCSVLEEGFAQTDRAGGLLKLRNTAGWNSGSSNVTEQEEECFLLVTWLDLTVSHTQSRNPFGCVVERSQVMLAGCWGAAVQQWWKCAGICSQSTRCEWIMHRVMRWGLCSGHLGIKTLLRGIWRRKTWHPWADFYGLFFFFFPSLEKGRICFCARWKERSFSVPEEFSRNFWFLQCWIALWSPVLGEAQPFLPPGSLQSWAFTCWEFLFPLTQAPELTDFSSFNSFHRGSLWWGHGSTKKNLSLREKRELPKRSCYFRALFK